MDIKGQVAIVTGGGSGLGAETARALAGCGAKVIVLDINQQQADQVAKEIQGVAFASDVTNPNSIEAVLEQIKQTYGSARICVNCAGIAPAKRIVGRDGAMPLEEFTKVIQVNLIGTFNVLRLVATAMGKLEPIGESQERGVIINTASVAAFEGQIGQAAYSAAKGGIVGLTLPAARELAQWGIRIMTIAPGIMATPMLSAMPQAVQESLAAAIPFPKRLGKPGEFAKLVLHIIDNVLLNGEVIRLDGAIRLPSK